jgi:hypothetical protein
MARQSRRPAELSSLASDMDARLSAAGLIAAGVTDNPHDFTFGRIEVPWFGVRKTVDVIFERESKDEPPTGRQIEAFCRLVSARDEFFPALEGTLFQYFRGGVPFRE